MKINPIIIFNIIISIFILIDCGIIYFLYNIKFNKLIAFILLGLIALFLIFILYKLNFNQPNINIEDIKKRKHKIFFDDDGFTIDFPLTETTQFIEWSSIEAIFLEKSIHRDGNYYSFQYTIFVNKNPKEKLYSKLKFYNNFFFFSKKKYSFVLINDYNNDDFYKFKNAIHYYLENTNPELNKYLNFKYDSSFKTSDFYKIYDLNNLTNNKTFERYRKYTENENK